MIVDLLKANKQKKVQRKKDADIYTGGYYVFGGVISGMLIHILWEKLNLPGHDVPINHALLTGKELENTNSIKIDKFIMSLLSTGLMLSELFGLKGGAASGSGMLMGYTFASTAKDGKYIGQT